MIDTSLDAWSNVKGSLKKRQMEIYLVIEQYPHHTAAEYGGIIHRSINSISGRFSELNEKNLIRRVERRACAVTGGNSWTWRVA